MDEKPYSVIYRDSDILIINKSSGVQVHPDNKNKGSTLTDLLIEDFPEIKNVGESPERPGIVHRLDKDTSGLILVCRNQRAFYYYKELFKKRKIKKTYCTLVYGNIKKDKGEIVEAIGRSLRNSAIRATGYAKDKKNALTYFTVLERFKINKPKPVEFTLCAVKPVTGRTHQIRVHLKSIGYPVVGDPIYKFKRQPKIEEVNRLFLTAKKLEFIDQKRIKRKFEIDLSESLKLVLDKLRHNSS